MSLVQRTFGLGEKGPRLDCWIFITNDEKGNEVFWFKAKDIAEYLEYRDPQQAVKKNVHQKWQKSWREFASGTSPSARRACGGDESDTFPSNWHPHTVFISEPGLYALIMRSKKPEAERFTAWIYEEVLPSLRKTGKYDINTFTSNDAGTTMCRIEEKYKLQLELMEAKMTIKHNNEIAELKAESVNRIADLNLTHDRALTTLKSDNAIALAEGQAKHERIVTEHVRREGSLRAELEKLRNVANMTAMEMGVNALLAQDNIRQNDEMRGAIEEIGKRVIPQMKTLPNKIHYACAYDYSVNGVKTVRITREQRERVEARDKIIRDYEENPTKRFKMSRCSNWVYGAVKFAEFECPNPISLWVKIRELYPHRCYGFLFTNNAKTELQPLSERELRARYNDDVRMCEEYAGVKRYTPRIEKFKALGLKDADDAVSRCLTRVLDIRETIVDILRGTIENVQGELRPKESPRRYDNFSETYSPNQLYNTVVNYKPVNVNNWNINYFNGTGASLATATSKGNEQTHAPPPYS